MRSELGESVATEMEKILCSNAHNDLFYKKASEDKCKCPDDCKCKKDNPCDGNCDCNDSSGDSGGPWGKESKADTLQNLCYTLNKISESLDNAGYTKSSVAVLKTLESLISEAGEEQMSAEEIAIIDQLNEITDDLEDGTENPNKLDEQLDILSDIWEEEDDESVQPQDWRDLLPENKSEEISEEEMDDFTKEIISANKEVDKWLEKYAGKGVIHRVSQEDPDLELNVDLSELSSEDDVDTKLIDDYLQALDSTFDDEE